LEAAFFNSKLASETFVLHEHKATMANLRHLLRVDGLDRFDFLHFATHAFSDKVTGRLSGLALADRDIWLDELWELAPLPPLVTLSACSGLVNRIYEGDEPVGLAMTCLAAGAQNVVGSLWPVADVYAPGLMQTFYQRLASGRRPANALTLAQRDAAESALGVIHWGGFQCVGCP
jgi:CHAT domain-containing protein